MVGDKKTKTKKQVSMKLIATLAPAQDEIEAGLWLRLTNYFEGPEVKRAQFAE
jgi:hypothetical protein